MDAFFGEAWDEKATFFELGGDSVDAVVVANLLGPPPMHYGRFLQWLKTSTLRQVIDRLAKIVEAAENDRKGGETEAKARRDKIFV